MKKNVYLTVCAAVFALAATALRLLQYVYIIDEKGRVVTVGLADTLLSYSVFGVIAAACIFALVIYLRDRSSVADIKSCCGGKFSAALSVLLTALTAAEGGLRIGTALKNGQVDIVGILAIPAAAYFAYLAAELAKDKSSPAGLVLGIFPSVYAVAKGVELFFGSFKAVNKTELQIETLSVCTLALFIISFTAVRAGVSVRLSRLKAVTLLFVSVSGAFALPSAFETLTGGGSMQQTLLRLVWLAQVFVLQIFALVCMIRAELVPPAQPPVTDSTPDLSELELYINEIPEQTDEDE